MWTPRHVLKVPFSSDKDRQVFKSKAQKAFNTVTAFRTDIALNFKSQVHERIKEDKDQIDTDMAHLVLGTISAEASMAFWTAVQGFNGLLRDEETNEILPQEKQDIIAQNSFDHGTELYETTLEAVKKYFPKNQIPEQYKI